jgi:polar amino acid transport system substrate-binding protein
LSILLFLGLGLQAEASDNERLAATAPVLVVAVEDGPYPPWILPTGEGLDLTMVRLAAARLSWRVRFEAMPWPRCLAAVTAGEVSACVGVSYQAERARRMRYPLTADGQPDGTYRLHTDTYVLLRRVGSAIRSDAAGLVLDHGGEAVAVQSGFSIGGTLRAQGLRIDESDRELETILRKLQAGRVIGAAVLADSVRRLLAEQSTRRPLVPQVEIVEPPLITKDYFLVFNPTFHEQHTAFAQALWEEFPRVRGADIYQELLRQEQGR